MAKWLDKYEQGGLVLKKKTKDNYGVKENPSDSSVSLPPGFVGMGNDISGRNYSPAWGGQFAMGGSIPGSVGFTYARTINPAPSEGPYAKKTMPSAEDGDDIPSDQSNNKTVQKNLKIAKAFQKNWLNSPMGQKMINASDPKNANKITKQRLHNVDTTHGTYNPNPTKEDIDKATTAYTDIYNGNIDVLPLGIEHPAYVHEVSHSADRPVVSGLGKFVDYQKRRMNEDMGTNFKISPRLIPKSDVNTITKNIPTKYKNFDGSNKEFLNYLSEPTEVRARLSEIRKAAIDKNIYNPLKQKITPEIYKKLKKQTFDEDEGADPLQNLRHLYDDNDKKIIKLLNTISENETAPSPDDVPTAENGQEMRFWQEGLDWKPKTISRNGSIQDYGQDIKLDQLTNFTNYNTKQPGGWLNKYSS
jgi:hypothetical protein